MGVGGATAIYALSSCLGLVQREPPLVGSPYLDRPSECSMDIPQLSAGLCRCSSLETCHQPTYCAIVPRIVRSKGWCLFRICLTDYAQSIHLALSVLFRYLLCVSACCGPTIQIVKDCVSAGLCSGSNDVRIVWITGRCWQESKIVTIVGGAYLPPGFWGILKSSRVAWHRESGVRYILLF